MRMLMQYGGRDGDRSGRTERGGRDDGLRNRDDYMEPEMRRGGRHRGGCLFVADPCFGADGLVPLAADKLILFKHVGICA